MNLTRKIASNTLISSLIPCGGGGKLSYTQLVPEIFPDYREITISLNIAFLNFSIPSCQKPTVRSRTDNFSFKITSGIKGNITIPISKWEKLLCLLAGKQVEVSVSIDEEGCTFLQAEAGQTISLQLYPSWSLNGRWVIFDSRRSDGLYTSPFFIYTDENRESGKSFLLSRKAGGTYSDSYNTPEFISGKIKNRRYTINEKGKS